MTLEDSVGATSTSGACYSEDLLPGGIPLTVVNLEFAGH